MRLKPVGRVCLCWARTRQGARRGLDRRARVWGAPGRTPKRMPEVESGARNTGSSAVRSPHRRCRPQRCQAWARRMSQAWCLLDMRNALSCQVKTAFRGGRAFGE